MKNETAHLIEASDLHKSYHDGRKNTVVLKGVDLRIEKGAFIAVIGQSGAGKSTLLHILGGLDVPTQGDVLFEGESLYSLDEAGLADVRNRRIGFVFQFYHLLGEFTVLENVMMPAIINKANIEKIGGIRAGAVDFLKRVGLGERLDYFPGQLSGGEKQRVAIVRSLINQPSLLLCDEPTGNLDSKAGEEIIGILQKFNREDKTAIVLVTHNLELAKQAAHVYHLRDGILEH